MDYISDLAFWGLGSSHAIPEGSVHAKSYAGTLEPLYIKLPVSDCSLQGLGYIIRATSSIETLKPLYLLLLEWLLKGFRVYNSLTGPKPCNPRPGDRFGKEPIK